MRIRLYSVQDTQGGLISVMARPRGGDWLADEVEALREAGVTTLVSLLTPDEVSEFELEAEEQECQKRGITFLTFPIRDRSVPALAAETYSLLEQLETRHLAQEHLVIHCRQGLGRAVLIAASLLVLNGQTPEQAFGRLSVARGCPVPETEEQRAWVSAFSHQAGMSRTRGEGG